MVWIVLMKERPMNKLARTAHACIVALICWGLLGGVCFAGRSGDLEYWQTQGASVDINKDFAFTVSQELRFGRHNGNPYLYNVDLGIVYKGLAEWLDLGFNFKKEYEQDSSGEFRNENRPNLNITVKGKLFELPVSNRSRLAWRDFETKEEVWRYRNRSTAKLPFRLTKLNLQPYVAEEWFVNIGDDNINQNRLFSGFSWMLTKNISGNVHYLWKTSKISGGWRDTNVIGTQFKILF
jgi:hypothetical protein